jgi:hypothetical protein
MHRGLIVGLLGLGRHRLRAGNCSRSLCQSSSAYSGQAACHEAAAAAAPAPAAKIAPKQLPGPPHGRRYLPVAVSAQLGPQSLPAAASVVGLQRQGCVSITVQCSPNAAGTQILVSVLATKLVQRTCLAPQLKLSPVCALSSGWLASTGNSCKKQPGQGCAFISLLPLLDFNYRACHAALCLDCNGAANA